MSAAPRASRSAAQGAANAAPGAANAAPGAYEGLRVLDFTHVVAGPLCTRMLADHGADVVKVERPGGDMMRHLPVQIGPDLNTHFAQYNCGKRSIALDLRSEQARELVLALCDSADVVVENFKPGTMERLGIGIEAMRKRNPRLVACSISTFGAVGPYASISGYGFIAEAYSGLMYLNGDADDPPSFFGTALADMATGAHAFAAIGAALYRRSVSGTGTHIDISSFDVLVTMIDHAIPLHNLTEGRMRFGKYGTRHPIIVPNGVTQAGDGRYVVYGVTTDAQFQLLCELMGSPALAKDPRYATAAARVQAHEEVYDAVDAWAATVADAEEIVTLLSDAGIAAARVREYTEIATDEHLVSRGTLAPVPFDGRGDVLMPSAPHPMSGLWVAPRGQAPLLGEHTHEVLVGELGLSEQRFGALVADGAILAR